MLEQLPIEVEPMAGESATGFALRATTCNGFNLHWLRRVLGLCDNALLSQRYARELSWVLNAPLDWLQQSLPAEGVVDGQREWHYYGHRMCQRNALRLRTPQICPTCVHRRGACDAVWDVSLVTACPEHGRLLIDQCDRCNRQLRWDRPAIDICNCGHPFAHQADLPAEDIGLLMSRLVADRFHHRHPPRSAYRALGLPDFVQGLSLYGFINLLYAFGAVVKRASPAACSSANRYLTSREWRIVAQRGLERMQAFARGTEFMDEAVKQTVLVRLVSHPVVEADRVIALQLLDRLDPRDSCDLTRFTRRRFDVQGRLFS